MFRACERRGLAAHLLRAAHMSNIIKTALIALLVAASAGCLTNEEDLTDEELDTVESELLGFRVAPSLQRELTRINNTETGRIVINRARNRGLHTIKVGQLAGNIEGLYKSSGVIIIENPNNHYTFQRLAHELLHAGGYHPHYYPDKGLVGRICRQANAYCPSWN